jgi:hypothetical protein
MSRITMVILIYHRHKPTDLIYENESLASIKGKKFLNHMSDY